MDSHRSRRQTCNKCGLSFSRTYIKRHRCDADEVDNNKPMEKRMKCENLPNSLETRQDVENNHSSLDDDYYFDDENESNIDCFDNILLTDSDSNSDVDFGDEEFVLKNEESKIIEMLISYFILKWQSFFKISNNAVQCLLTFLCLVFNVVCKFKITVPSYFKLRKCLNENAIAIKKYVVCGSCYKLYNIEDCTITIEGVEESKRCSNVLYPKHTQMARRLPCNEILMRKTKSTTGKIKLTPKFQYCYHSLQSSLQEIMLRPNSKKLCSAWRSRQISEDILQDIYDGNMWKDLEKSGYFESDNNLCVMLNVDWFQPYARSTYSVGVLYLVLLNLPRKERLKKENILLVGVIPHLGREPASVNSFLGPLVDELSEAYGNGIELNTHDSPTEKEVFHVRLICVSCDIPAVRKVCGFLGHGAKFGCSKCMQAFEFDDDGNQCCGNFDKDNMTPRLNSTHRANVRLIQRQGITQTKKKEMESKLGVRYSELLKLPYLDIVRCHTVDAMHNLMLGTAKRMTMHWVNTKLLTSKQLDEIQEQISAFVVPTGIGRIPHKISSGLSSFTADEWRHWTVIYSLVLLKTKLGKVHYQLWQLFVRAFHLVCRPEITKAQVRKADMLFYEFGIECEKLYGKSFITPNMHLHLHLITTILDFGPVYATWCFALERMNGLMGLQTNNNKNIEEQIMRKLLIEINLGGDTEQFNSTNYNSKYLDIINFMNSLVSTKKYGRMSDVMNNYSLSHLSSQSLDIQNVDWSVSNHEIIVSKGEAICLQDTDNAYLEQLYKLLYPGKVLTVSQYAIQHKRMRLESMVFGSRESGCNRLSHILAYWKCQNNEDILTSELKPGQICNLYMHTVCINGEAKTHALAKVEWYADLDNTARRQFGTPIQVYSPLFNDRNFSTWIPVFRLRCHFAYTYHPTSHRRLLIVAPVY